MKAVEKSRGKGEEELRRKQRRGGEIEAEGEKDKEEELFWFVQTFSSQFPSQEAGNKYRCSQHNCFMSKFVIY